MCSIGGVYTDTDTLCVRPIQEWNREASNDAEALFSVEDVFRRGDAAHPVPSDTSSGWGVAGASRYGVQHQQWTLAGAPGHAVFCGMPERIR
jgi:mannosyltransferase OCH1-like enzyme